MGGIQAKEDASDAPPELKRRCAHRSPAPRERVCVCPWPANAGCVADVCLWGPGCPRISRAMPRMVSRSRNAVTRSLLRGRGWRR